MMGMNDMFIMFEPNIFAIDILTLPSFSAPSETKSSGSEVASASRKDPTKECPRVSVLPARVIGRTAMASHIRSSQSAEKITLMEVITNMNMVLFRLWFGGGCGSVDCLIGWGFDDSFSLPEISSQFTMRNVIKMVMLKAMPTHSPGEGMPATGICRAMAQPTNPIISIPPAATKI